MELTSTKQQIIEFIKSLPEDLSFEEITYRLYLEQRLVKAQQQIKEGKYHTHEEAKEIMKKWLE
jgi:uncharacterized protein YpmS